VIIPAVFTSPGPVLFQLGPITLRWYGLLIALAVLIGLNLSSWLAKQRNLESGLISDLLPILVLAAIIGARLYYVAFEWRSYQNSWWDVFAIWKGGIAIHGALIGGTISVISAPSADFTVTTLAPLSPGSMALTEPEAGAV